MSNHPTPSRRSLELAAQAWCFPTTADKVMDTVLATAFASILDQELASLRAQVSELEVLAGLTRHLAEQPDQPQDHADHLEDKSRRHYLTQAEVLALHPMDTGEYDCYRAALVMVGERHDKYDLVELVHALLVKLKRAATIT